MTTRTRPLQVSVLCGNLKFVGSPLLVGHYVASRLSGTEKVVDDYIGGAMSALLKAGRYPEQPGRYRFFVNRRQNPLNPLGLPRPPHVLVAGLGPEGKLDSNQLLETVREAAIGWSQRMSDRKSTDKTAPLELAVTLMGSGGSGIGPGTSAQAIVQGVQKANEVLLQGGWLRITQLHLVEMYLDRATEAWLALRQLHQATHGLFTLDDTVQTGMGALRRTIDTSYRGADYDYISAVTSDDGNIVYTLDTKRARTEVRIQATQVALVRKLIERASGATCLDPELGRALFKLLVPVGMEATLGATTELVLELDDGTAAIPWELLDAPAGQRTPAQEPWALRNRLLRRLRTVNFRQQVRDASRDDAVLVIGEPLVDATQYPALPAARAEANAVAKVLGGPKGVGRAQVHALIASADGRGPDATTVIKALLTQKYRVVHIAGHGEPPLPAKGRQQAEPRGVVLSDGAFLGPREVADMDTAPELVFLNCCHLAADPQKLLREGFDRSAFAAAVARELIRLGVRCVVAAGWAVDDEPANAFAVALYRSLLDGKRFADAVNDARRAAWNSNPGSNTWAAYQCYGDQDWTWQRRGGTDATTHAAPDPAKIYASIATPVALVIALETLAVENDTQGAWTTRERRAQHAAQRRQLRYLEARFASKWGKRGDVAAAFGIVWMKADDTKRALHWFELAITANDGGASLRAAEQRANLLARRARSRGDIDTAHAALQALLTIGATAEREALLGSVSKRLARIESAAGNHKAERGALQDMATCYRRSETLAIKRGSADVFYPSLNLLAAELLAGRKLDAARVRRTRESLQGRQLTDPDFWSAAGLAELEVLVALDAHRLAKAAHAIEEVLEDLHSRAGGAWLWEATADQLDFILARVSKARGDEGRAARRLRARVRGYAEAG